LINPARPKGVVVGVAEPSLGPLFVDTLKELGVQRAMVVCGAEHLDEISVAGPTFTWSFLEDGEVREQCVEPSDFGLSSHPLSSVVGSSPSENAELLLSLLTPGASPITSLNGPDPCAVLDFILMNAAALLKVAGLASSYIEGASLARESIISGRALGALETLQNI